MLTPLRTGSCVLDHGDIGWQLETKRSFTFQAPRGCETYKRTVEIELKCLLSVQLIYCFTVAIRKHAMAMASPLHCYQLNCIAWWRNLVVGNTQRTGTLTAASHTCSHRRRHRRKEGHAERGTRQPGGAGGSGGRYVKRHGIGAPELAVDAVVRSVVCHVARLGLVPAVVVAALILLFWTTPNV